MSIETIDPPEELVPESVEETGSDNGATNGTTPSREDVEARIASVRNRISTDDARKTLFEAEGRKAKPQSDNANRKTEVDGKAEAAKKPIQEAGKVPPQRKLEAGADNNGKPVVQDKPESVTFSDEEKALLKQEMGGDEADDPDTLDEKNKKIAKNLAKLFVRARDREKKAEGQTTAARQLEGTYKQRLADKDMEVLAARAGSDLTPGQWRAKAKELQDKGDVNAANVCLTEAARLEDAKSKFDQATKQREGEITRQWTENLTRLRVEIPELSDRESPLFQKVTELLNVKDPKLANLYNNDPDGIRYAVGDAQRDLLAASASDLRTKLTTAEQTITKLKADLKERERKLSPSKGEATKYPSGEVNDKNLTIEERIAKAREKVQTEGYEQRS